MGNPPRSRRAGPTVRRFEVRERPTPGRTAPDGARPEAGQLAVFLAFRIPTRVALLGLALATSAVEARDPAAGEEAFVVARDLHVAGQGEQALVA